jgi:phosphatidylglycerophosphate synthase
MLTAVSHVPARVLAITLGRLLVVPIIILAFDRAQVVVIGALIAFIAVDLFDGVLARDLHADDTARRVLDTVVDRSSVYPVYVWLTVTGWLPAWLLALFIAREAYCAYWGYVLLRRRAAIVKADWFYRSFNLTLAGWVIVAPLVSHAAGAWIFFAVLVYSLAVARDLALSVRVVLAMTTQVHGLVLPAGELRIRHCELACGVEIAAVMPSPGSGPLRSA